MDRRKFLELSAFSSAGAFVLNGHSVSAFSQTRMANVIPQSIIDDRCLVMIQLRGGNDGLNTLIPINQYDEYARLRPTLRIKESGSNVGIQLDNTLANEDKLMLHPALTGFKALYDSGKLSIIHGVGYPKLNKSHFSSRALMFQGGDGTPENFYKSSGWMARFLHAGYDHNNYSDPLGIQLGSKKPSLGFQSGHDHKVDVNLAEQDLAGFYNVISNIGAPKPEIPSSDFGEALSHIASIESNISNYSQRISEVFNVGLNKRSLESNVTYPQNDLADQLKTVATLIRGGSKTKVFLVAYDGFDTHANQADGSVNDNKSHEGQHADLLRNVSDTVKSFQDDLEALGVDEQVVSATFTEFGRKPAENGNLGTDHGNLGPMFVIGKHINPGVIGKNADLSVVTDHYDNDGTIQYDYRQVFSTIIGDYLGASSSVIDKTEFNEFDRRIDLIEASQKADASLSTGSVLNKANGIRVYPNPVTSNVTISMLGDRYFRGKIIVKSITGATALQLTEDFAPRLNTFSINMSHLSSGIYVLSIQDGTSTVYTHKLVKK